MKKISFTYTLLIIFFNITYADNHCGSLSDACGFSVKAEIMLPEPSPEIHLRCIDDIRLDILNSLNSEDNHSSQNFFLGATNIRGDNIEASIYFKDLISKNNNTQWLSKVLYTDDDNKVIEEISEGLWDLYIKDSNNTLTKVLPYGSNNSEIVFQLTNNMPENFMCGIGHENMTLKFMLNNEKINEKYLNITSKISVSADIGIVISEKT